MQTPARRRVGAMLKNPLPGNHDDRYRAMLAFQVESVELALELDPGKMITRALEVLARRKLSPQEWGSLVATISETLAGIASRNVQESP